MFVSQVDVNTVWTASTDGTIGIWKVKPPSIKVESSKLRSNSMKEEEVGRKESLTKFSSVPLNKAKKLHPCLFSTSKLLTLQSTEKKVENKMTTNSRRVFRTVNNLTKFMKPNS